MREQKTKAQVKKNFFDNTHLLSPYPHSDMNEPPPTYTITLSLKTIQWAQNSWYK